MAARAGGGAGGVAQHLLGEVHQIMVRPVGRIELHHRELGVVADRDAFVAEVAVDLEHPLEAADDQALQIQLRRDAQVHLLVERVVMRDEGLGIGAAGDRVQHRRFDFQEVMLDHMAADRGHRLGAGHETGAGGLVGDQVDIALAVLLLLVGHAVELVRQWAQALGQQAQRRHAHRQLARLGAEQGALGADDVAHVQVLEVGIGLLAERILGDEELDAAGGVLQGAEAGLAHHPLEHQAAGHADRDVLRLQLLVGQIAIALRSAAGRGAGA